MNAYTRFFTLFSLLLSISSFADYYQAPMQDSNWELKRSKNTCQLRHVIPLYGTADFIQRSGHHLQFSIQELRRKPQVIKASLAALPAPWMRGRADPVDYQVYLDQADDAKDYGRLSVYGETAEVMIDALLQGQFPTFTYIRASSGNNVEETRVQVSSIKFSDSYKEFSECRKNLLPAADEYNVLSAVSTKQHRFTAGSTAQNQLSQAAQNSQPLQNKTLYFDSGNIRLNDWLKKEVIAVAEYMRSSPASTAVISSATAIAGKADHHLFAKRAGSIVKQLEKSGIAAGRITVKPNASAADKGIRIDVFGPDALRLFYVNKSSAGLNTEEKQRLNLLARYVLEYFKQGRLLISSHTDSSGARASNHKATQRRADVFKQYLQSRGVASDIVQIKAYGEDRPVKSNRYPEGQAQNRRILIDFVV